MRVRGGSRGAIEKTRALIALTRPPNAIMMFIAILSGILLSDNKVFQMEKLLLSFVTAYGLCGSSMGFNDYFDREVDKVNAPWRPIPAGIISESDAILTSSILASVGMLSAAATSMHCFVIAVIAFISAFTYNAQFKKMGFVGNNIVSAIVVAPFIYGSVLSDGYISQRLITFILPVYLSNLGREVIKGISDIEGDALRGVRSVARIRGEVIAARLGAIFYLAAVSISPLPYIFGLVNWSYVPIVLIADAGFIHCAISITRSPTKENSLRVKNWTLLWMLIALIAFIAGSL
ncbi:MAG: UbiA family prenyltransferase [Nitrososphaeria archaeon]|nr:UbiA family prenyltransferase [Nitrososphaeria archaeon]MDW8021685.1 UbiA family prenyltransferase [Nitrososphaerota archaeon]